MAYIDTKYLGKCETCRHHSDSGCNTFCDCGEEYSPDLSKIPTADVVEVVRCKDCVNRVEFDTNKFHCELTEYYCGEAGYCSDAVRIPKERSNE